MRYDALVASRLDESVDPVILRAYAGEYEIPEISGPPGLAMIVIPGERSLMLHVPGYGRHELFPESATEFFHVALDEFTVAIAYEVRFGLYADRRVEYLEMFSSDQTIRLARLGPESFVPEVVTAGPAAAATVTSTATLEPTARSSATATALPMTIPEPATSAVQVAPTSTQSPVPSVAGDGAFPWGWLILVVVIVGTTGPWLVLRRRRKGTHT